MFRIIRYLRALDWVMLGGLLAFLVLQIYCDVTLPTYTAEIVTKMQAGESAGKILATGKVMLVYAAISVGATIIETILSVAVSTRLGKRIRKAVFEHTLTFSEKESARFSTSTLLTRTTNDVQQVVSTTVLGLRLGIGSPLMAIMAIIKIAQSTWELTVATGVGIVILLLGIMTILFIVTPKFKLVQKLIDRLNGVTRENLTGVRVIRAFNAETYQHKRFEKVSDEYAQTNIFTGRVMAVLNPFIMLVNYGITIAIYWLGCYLIVENNNPAFFPTIFSFTQLAGQVVMAFMVMLMLLMMLPRAQVSANRINEVILAKSEIRDPKEEQRFTEEGTVCFENVKFTYDGEKQPVFENVSFFVKKGQTFAIIGATASGKSTLIKLIPRFLDAGTGIVKVNGVNVKQISLRVLRKTIGYVPQKSFLFSGTVRENLAFANAALSDGEIQKAANVACADGFIGEKENGYDSAVSQGGKNFSGGQRQRLAIARAVAIKPQILIFDDSFSALDYATDARVQKNIKEFAPDTTKIIVAQRIGTVMDADCILVLDKGQVVGLGTHKELLDSCDVYREIVRSQISDEEATA